MTTKEKIKRFIPKFVLSVYHYKLALLGAIIFGFPGKSKGFKIIGVTGTSGKSTTCDFLTRILEEAQPSPEASAGKAGNKVASISSIRFKVAGKEWENKYKMTMPGRFVIQKFLRQAKSARCKFVVLEVTSEGIKQFRHKFINFDTVVFTNLGQEHLESHGSFENYRNAKLKLFKENKNIHVINADDENAKYFLDVPAKKKITFSIKDQEALKIKLNLLGDFNVMNALAAISAAKNYGISLDVCLGALEKAKGISGRMEVVLKEPFMVVVDYAHTPDQLESAYKSFEGRPLVCVLGSCGGGRDKWKRPVLGEIAQKYCKEIIITNEDPYDENPLKIMDEIESGFSQIRNSKFEIRNYEKIMDRKEAIKKAMQLARPGDVVIITGKGSEPWMCVANGRKIPWDDRQIVKESLGD
ncbi:MAG: UDP-N-acetylmuramoyl-L-alanyl-D-glutamate--2,6-diaminopimelate ligase [Candidatus Staskawiczbacteria bacterium]|nr:UDP-N-acetylmuramoyl-L-alanyl-D-glutamate--2,6-diaminopimelate ligase [Candidatus Staskawiczbacteria bacterium]